jgi:hypothetical protein
MQREIAAKDDAKLIVGRSVGSKMAAVRHYLLHHYTGPWPVTVRSHTLQTYASLEDVPLIDQSSTQEPFCTVCSKI